MSSENRFLSIQACILENYHSYNFTIASLCESQNISRVTLHRILKTYTSQSATEYINEVRLKAAYQSLSKSETPVKEIAVNVGFFDPKYFSRLFKRKFGIAPSQIRAKN